MKALITGIAGQDAGYLAEFLLEKGYEVYGMYRRSATDIIERTKHLNGRVKLVEGDLIDSNSLVRLIKEIMPDEVYNLASQSFVPASWTQTEATMEITGKGVSNLLEAIRIIKPDTKFYSAGSSEQFGKVQEVPQKETTPFHPRSPYSVAKVFGYYATINYRESYHMFACSGILFNHECFNPNTPLLVRHKGIIKVLMMKEIRKIREDKYREEWDLDKDSYEVFDGEKWVKLKYISAFKQDKKDSNHILKIYNTRQGIINVTNNHNLYSFDNDKKRADSFKLGDKLKHCEMPSGNIFSVVSLEEAELMGMMVADGWCSNEGGGNFTKNDSKIIERFSDLWKRVALGYIYKYEVTEEKAKEYDSYGKSNRLTLLGNSNYLKGLQKQIYTNYEKYKKVPEVILNSSYEVRLSFLRGYNNCDGLKKNSCTYEFKNFKTNSPVLALGLIYLITTTLKQEYTLNFEEDEKETGYYSINILSNREKTISKMEKVVAMKGLSQRGIARETGYSRIFIRKVNNGYIPLKNPLMKERFEIKKIVVDNKQPEYVYNVETESGKLMAGVGNIVVGNSPRRPKQFVTRKITNAVARIKLGLQDKLSLGNLEAKRDWGYSKEFIEAMYLMLQQKEPDDYVIATGETHSIREFVEEAFKVADMEIKWEGEGLNEVGKVGDKIVVDINKEFYRPAEVDLLIGDYSKAKKILGWEPKTKFKDLVKLMVENDLKEESK